jgi:hypothetical protein
MRKRLITPISRDASRLHDGWLELDRASIVEVTSEDKDYPMEGALVAGEMQGWRAADSGTQTIRLIFDEPQRVKRIALVVEETETERTQEFVLRWSADRGHSFEKLCASSGISVRLKPYARSRIITLRFRMSPYLN